MATRIMNKNFIFRVYQSLIRYLYVQLFITCASLPILLAWGLPISFALCVGNLLFNPILFLFLFFSSLIFFTELLYIPNSWIIQLLEYTTTGWSWILAQGSSAWLLELPYVHGGILCVMALLPFLILHYAKLQTPIRGIIGLSVLLCILCIGLKYCQSHCVHLEIPYQRESLVVIRNDNQTVLVDPGLLGQKKSTIQWVEYTLVPTLIKSCGTSTIDYLILLQPTMFLFDTVEKLAHCCSIKNVYIPYWHGSPSRNYWYSYHAAMKTLRSSNCIVHRLGMQHMKISVGSGLQVSIHPLDVQLSTTTYSYQAYTVVAVGYQKEVRVVSRKAAKKLSIEK